MSIGRAAWERIDAIDAEEVLYLARWLVHRWTLPQITRLSGRWRRPWRPSPVAPRPSAGSMR
jgi:hypothetical protein